MSPVCSTIGMKSDGGSRPRSGCCQRTSASAPWTREAVHAHDRLVEDHDLVSVEGAPELAEHAQPAYRVAVERGRVHLATRVRLLGRVHRDVGAPQQRVRIVPVAREAGDSDAHPHLERHLVDANGLLDARDQLVGDLLELIRVAGVLARQNRELVAAEARDQTARADDLPQPRSEIAQQLVAEVVAERVVDLLEAVEVEQHHAERRPGGGGGLNPLVQPRPEALPIRKPGELVRRRDAM